MRRLLVGVVATAGLLLTITAADRMPAQTTAQTSSAAVPTTSAPDFPGDHWQPVTPESQGYSSRRLDALRGWLATGPTASMMVIVHGRLIFSYGDTAGVGKIASVRKSVLSMLYGANMDRLSPALDRNVEQLGLAEPGRPFLPIEKTATLIQLLSGRSGIYLLPAESTPERDILQASQPRRGSEFPGGYFHYNDWDFNAAGTAFETLTGSAIYDALDRQLARPLAFEDFDRSRQAKVPPPAGEVHAEYAMYLSARDMARLGLLMLRGGRWNGKQVLSAEWVQASTSIWTPFEEMNPPALRALGSPERWGFGLMWWVWDARPYPGDRYVFPFQGAFEARGVGGQYITVLPARDMVLVHTVAIDPSPRGSLEAQGWDAITNMVLASACNGPCR